MRRFNYVALFFLTVPLIHATSMGKLTVLDKEQHSRTITYEKINDDAIIEGDIIIGKLSRLSEQGALIRHKIGGSLWPNGIIPYEIADDLPLMNKMAVRQALSHWQKYTSIQFIEVTSKNRNEFHDYIAFIPVQGTLCASFVGRQGGRQEIKLSSRCTNMITVHEIGHALGLWHEQSRADRESYITILWENIKEGHRFNFDQHLSDGNDFGDYDYQSIMHYGPYAFSKNGEKTIEPLIQGVEIGQRNQVSEKDIAAIEAMYPKDTD